MGERRRWGWGRPLNSSVRYAGSRIASLGRWTILRMVLRSSATECVMWYMIMGSIPIYPWWICGILYRIVLICIVCVVDIVGVVGLVWICTIVVRDSIVESIIFYN